MTIWFVVGTAAELIKLFPLIHKAKTCGRDWKIISTGQSHANLLKQLHDFSIPGDKIQHLLTASADLKTSSMALNWFGRALLRVLFFPRSFPIGSGDTLFVHGDTLSTVLGALLGWRLNHPIVHVEAGMRSHNWRSPFPEELNRRFVSRLADLNMTPDDNAAENLRREGVEDARIVVTNGNTIVDALELVTENLRAPSSYVLVNVHRFENLRSEEKMKSIIELLLRVAQEKKLIFVLMPNTLEYLRQRPELRARLEKAGIEMRERLPFGEFAGLLQGADFVLSDGGSNQQECHYLGKPLLILRDVTESVEGIGGCCVLSKFNDDVINTFLSNPKSFSRPRAFPALKPTDIIFGRLNL